MKKIITKKIIIYVLIVVLAFLVGFLSYAWGKKTWPFSEPKYQAVGLISGDIYYGHLSLFPCPKLTDVYFVRSQPAEKEGGEPQTKLMSLGSLFFSPENVLHLQKNQILWWTDLQKDSQVLQLIKQQKQ